MGKLLQRLQDASRSGAYRIRGDIELLDALRGGELSLERVSLEGVTGKGQLLERIARTLHFPDWFGHNWDALKDCLADLSWLGGSGHVLLFRDYSQVPPGDLGALIEILASSAEVWAAHDEPFFALFVDPDGRLPLAELFLQK